MDFACSRVNMSGLYFHQGQKYEILKDKKYVDIIGSLSLNVFRNQRSVNFIIKEIL